MIACAAESTLPQPSLISGIQTLTHGIKIVPTEGNGTESWGNNCLYSPPRHSGLFFFKTFIYMYIFIFLSNCSIQPGPVFEGVLPFVLYKDLVLSGNLTRVDSGNIQ